MFACLAVFRDRGFSGFLICRTCSERLLSCHSAENIPLMQQEVSITNCWHPNSALHKWMFRMPAAPQLRTRPSWSRGIGTAEGNEQKMAQIGQIHWKIIVSELLFTSKYFSFSAQCSGQRRDFLWVSWMSSCFMLRLWDWPEVYIPIYWNREQSEVFSAI